VLFGTNIVELLGESRLEGVRLDKPADGQDNLKVDGLFVEIGSDPDQTLIGQLELKTNKGGLIETQADQKTSRAGVWAAGDITTGSDGFRQIITATSEGAIAAQSVFKHLQAKK